MVSNNDQEIKDNLKRDLNFSPYIWTWTIILTFCWTQTVKTLFTAVRSRPKPPTGPAIWHCLLLASARTTEILDQLWALKQSLSTTRPVTEKSRWHLHAHENKPLHSS